MNDWRGGGGHTRRSNPPAEYSKLVLLAFLLLACGGSYFYDPFSPRSSDGGYVSSLSVNVPLGIGSPKDWCKGEALREAQCRKDATLSGDTAEKQRPVEGEGSWAGFFRQAGSLADQREREVNGVRGGSSSSGMCDAERSQVEQCRRAGDMVSGRARAVSFLSYTRQDPFFFASLPPGKTKDSVEVSRHGGGRLDLSKFKC